MKNETILVVEDEPAIREMIVTTLEMAGFDCLQAAEVSQAHHLVVDHRPNLILLDWMLPNGLSGIDLCRRLKKDEMLSETPIIMLTAKGEEDNKVQGLDAGADDYITKPFSSTYLKTRILSLLRQRKQLQDLYLSKLSEHTQEEDHINGWEPSQPQVTPYDEQFMQQVMAFMEEQMDNTDITIDDFANKLMLSRTVFYRKLKSIVGLTPVDFVCEMRIKRAAQLIEKSEYSFSQIAYMTGFNDPKYFSRRFKKIMGVTPTEYKERKGDAS